MKIIGQHFINEGYQKNFTDSNGQVWVLNESDKIFNTIPKNVFKEKHFYTINIKGFPGNPLIVEKNLCQIEGDFANVVNNKINKGLNLKDLDKVAITLFISAMFNRTKASRENIKKFLEEIVSDHDNRPPLSEKEEKTAAATYISSENSVSYEELKEGLKNFSSWHSLSTLNTTFNLVDYILQMKWTLFKAPIGKTFVSSDNPISMRSPNREKLYGRGAFGSRAGIKHLDTEIVFPISSDYVLHLSWNRDKPNNMIATEKQYNELLKRIVNTSKTIFGSNKEILEFILKTDAEN